MLIITITIIIITIIVTIIIIIIIIIMSINIINMVLIIINITTRSECSDFACFLKVLHELMFRTVCGPAGSLQGL